VKTRLSALCTSKQYPCANDRFMQNPSFKSLSRVGPKCHLSPKDLLSALRWTRHPEFGGRCDSGICRNSFICLRLIDIREISRNTDDLEDPRNQTHRPSPRKKRNETHWYSLCEDRALLGIYCHDSRIRGRRKRAVLLWSRQM
jgi:hypothetical protein